MNKIYENSKMCWGYNGGNAQYIYIYHIDRNDSFYPFLNLLRSVALFWRGERKEGFWEEIHESFDESLTNGGKEINLCAEDISIDICNGVGKFYSEFFPDDIFYTDKDNFCIFASTYDHVLDTHKSKDISVFYWT